MSNQKQMATALLAGIVFGFGLSVAQMIDPAKVVNFLDVFGTWDPSLAFVMGGGLLVNAIATPWIFKRGKPIVADLFHLPTKKTIDKRIVFGGVLFGIGWGLAGYCPGPMLTSLSFFNADILTIVFAYLVGTWVTKQVLARM
ncbi:YeeE/YedE family protein [Marinimicrobium alkaliphilum]|uniref:YeeE/YedE family protein n=1 Tax=Marinimicrobium alkaliphilum TaxID=2202654 RepID=UPI000DB98130|nr:YeeE/YedE family protein [Marinimicrobium alkaliphilum]